MLFFSFLALLSIVFRNSFSYIFCLSSRVHIFRRFINTSGSGAPVVFRTRGLMIFPGVNRGEIVPRDISRICDFTRGSNGKSSIVEERLYSFFFALFQKNEASFFFVFPLLHNHRRRRSFCFDLVHFLKVSIRSVSFSKFFEIHQFVLPSTLKVLG